MLLCTATGLIALYSLYYTMLCMFLIKGRRHNSFPLATNFSHNVTEPSKGISYTVGDVCRHFTKMTWPCAYILDSNLIPQTDGKNGFL